MDNIIDAKDYISFLQSKLGTPYVFGAKPKKGPLTQSYVDWLAKTYPSIVNRAYLSKIASKGLVGKVCTDCSGTVCWPWSNIDYGSEQLYAKAYARLPMSQLSKFAAGTVLYKPGHVGIYIGKDSSGQPICLESKGIDYGTIQGKITNPNRWKCGLTFSWMNYDIENPIPSNQISYKGLDPFPTPTTLVRKGDKGDSVKFVQFELVESGYGYPFKYNNHIIPAIIIDGEFGNNTESGVKAFQLAYGLEVDGIVGPKTIEKMIENQGSIFADGRCPYQFQSRMIKYGNRGYDVLCMQWCLNHIYGYTYVQVDGDFGTMSLKALKDFQTKCGLQADGIVGPATKVALLAHNGEGK